MKLIFKNFDINYENISFAKIKQNMIMEGTFTKIIYSDPFVTMNGLYILIPLIFNFPSHTTEKIYSMNSSEQNIEDEIISITDEGGELDPEVTTYKQEVNKYLFFYSYTPHNLFIIKKVSELELLIINYYKDYYEIKKKVVLNLLNLLNLGRIKIYKDLFYISYIPDIIENKHQSHIIENDSLSTVRSCKYFNEEIRRGESGINPYFQENSKENSFHLRHNSHSLNFPSQVTENWSSPTLRSGESVNLSKIRSDKLSFDFDSIPSRKLNSENFPNNKIVLKISGIWETNTEIGLTYKFIEMYKNS
jgi:hypothetical protein